MKKLLTGLVAMAIVAAVVVGWALAGAKTGTVPRAARSCGGEATRSGGLSPVFARAGMMPEIVVTAERPGIVMPTVEVHGFRTVALSGSGINADQEY